MEICIIGLGRMGANIARRLARAGHTVVVYNRTTEKAYALAKEENERRMERKGNVSVVEKLEDVKEKLSPPRIVWVMVPAGAPTEMMINSLS